MKSLWKRFGTLFLALAFAFGSAVALSGCEDDDGPIEETADEVEEETD
jgi:hypothetical protein